MSAEAPVIRGDWITAPETRAVFAALDAAGRGESRFVGGCVRNALMGRQIDDIDIATQLLPQEVEAAARAAGIAAHPTGIEHGTVTLVSNHKPFEVTTLRRDVSTDGRRAIVAFTRDWAEDAARRDFRMNALYADAAGRISDPTGGGVADVRAGRIQFIGDPRQRLREDHLRILRFFRFSAWYARGDLDAAGLLACADMKAGVAALSAERVWKEFRKLMAAPDPRPALRAMAQIGVLEIVAPEAARLARALDVIAADDALMLPADAMTRTAAMLPDADAARAFAQRLKLSNEERDRLTAALGGGARIVSYMSLRELRRLLYAIGQTAFVDRARIAWAEDDNPRTATQWRALLSLAGGWVRPKFPLGGEDARAAGVRAGPQIGVVLREVESWWIDSDFPDDRLSIIERLKTVAQALG